MNFDFTAPGRIVFGEGTVRDAPAAHKATAHYATWRDAVEPMMAEPRRSTKYEALFPEGARWEMP